MSGIALLFLCLGLGLVLQRNSVLKSTGPYVLNQFVINISLPAMALYYIPQVQLRWDLMYPFAIAWICFGLSWVLFASLGKIYGWSRKLIGCLVVVCGLGNTSFVGFPIIEALYGQSGLETALIIDQPGTFVAMSTLGIFAASLYSREATSARAIGARMLKFPPLIVFLIALALNLLSLNLPEWLFVNAGKLAATVTPVALVSVGLQLQIGNLAKHIPFLSLGLCYKLLLFPAFIWIVYSQLFGLEGQLLDVCVMEAAMAPMITGAIVASSHGLKPKLCAQLIGIGIPLSFITLGCWYLFLNMI